jgi:hypothetical protein
MPGRRILTNPKALVFQVDAAVYDRLLELLADYREEEPRAQMAGLLRAIIGKAIEGKKTT